MYRKFTNPVVSIKTTNTSINPSCFIIALSHYIHVDPDNFFNLQHNDESHRMDQPGRDMLVTINSFILGNTSVISMVCLYQLISVEHIPRNMPPAIPLLKSRYV